MSESKTNIEVKYAMESKILPVQRMRNMGVGAYGFCNSRIAFTAKSVADNIQLYFSMNVQTHIKIFI